MLQTVNRADITFLRTYKLWDLSTNQEKATLKGHTANVASVAFRPDNLLLASGSWDGTVRIWDGLTCQEKLTLRGHSDEVTSVAFSPGGKLVASGTFRAVIIWYALVGRQKVVFRPPRQVTSVAFSPDGKLLAVAVWPNTVELWDVLQAGSRQRSTMATFPGA